MQWTSSSLGDVIGRVVHVALSFGLHEPTVVTHETKLDIVFGNDVMSPPPDGGALYIGTIENRNEGLHLRLTAENSQEGLMLAVAADAVNVEQEHEAEQVRAVMVTNASLTKLAAVAREPGCEQLVRSIFFRDPREALSVGAAVAASPCLTRFLEVADTAIGAAPLTDS